MEIFTLTLSVVELESACIFYKTIPFSAIYNHPFPQVFIRVLNLPPGGWTHLCGTRLS